MVVGFLQQTVVRRQRRQSSKNNLNNPTLLFHFTITVLFSTNIMNEVFKTAADQFRQKLPQLTQNQEVSVKKKNEKEEGRKEEQKRAAVLTVPRLPPHCLTL